MNAQTRFYFPSLIFCLVLFGSLWAVEPAKSLAVKTPESPVQWIWHTAKAPEKGEKPIQACFRRTVTIPDAVKMTYSVMAVTADASLCQLYVNGILIGEKQSEWTSVWGPKIQKHLKPGKNVIAIIASKASGNAGLIGQLTVHFASGSPLIVGTDSQWKVSTAPSPDWTTENSDDSAWVSAKEIGPLGTKPWGQQVMSLTPTRQSVAWPVAPSTRPLTREQGDALLEADWMQQVGNDPTKADILNEIVAARQIADRFAQHPKKSDFSSSLKELDFLAAKLEKITDWETEKLTEIYFSVRRLKRQIVMRNPVIDFERILLIDGCPPAGHESGHRNTYGGDLRRIGDNRILVLDTLRPDAKVQEVVPNNAGGVMRMDLSFDASKLVYSMVPKGQNSFHLYEVSLGADGAASSERRQLTNSPYHDEDPMYLPDGKIMFCTTRGNTYVRCLPGSPCTVLARCDADGKNIRIISNNNEPDFTPSLLHNGQVLFTRWEYTERPLWRLQKLWTINPDGTGLAHYWGNRSAYPDVVWEARAIPGSNRVMFTGVGHHQVGGGPIGVIDVNEGRDAPEGLYKVTAEIPWTESNGPTRVLSEQYRACDQMGWFASPYPLSTHDFLVSARGTKSGARSPYWLYLMDIDGNRELIYAGTGNDGIWCAMPLRPRVKPPIIPDRAIWPKSGEKAETGTLYSFNVYDGTTDIPLGKAKYLRILQQDAKTYSMGFKSIRHSGPLISALQEDAVKRILGTVPVQESGWVSFKVPAGRALYFQLLDADQRCIQIMRSFTGVMPGEIRGCTGCHEGHNTTPRQITVTRQYAPVEITPPPWGADVSISYERFAQPILDKYCGKCHQGEGKGRAVLDLTLRGGIEEKGIEDQKLWPCKEPYLTLIGSANWGIGKDAKIDPKSRGYGFAGAMGVEAYGSGLGPRKPMTSLSYTSPLIQMVMSGKHNKVKIEGDDLLRLIAWVDSNCVYRGDEEVRQIPDPDEATYRKQGWTVPPKTRTAPVIDRNQPINDPPVESKK